MELRLGKQKEQEIEKVKMEMNWAHAETKEVHKLRSFAVEFSGETL